VNTRTRIGITIKKWQKKTVEEEMVKRNEALARRKETLDFLFPRLQEFNL